MRHVPDVTGKTQYKIPLPPKETLTSEQVLSGYEIPISITDGREWADDIGIYMRRFIF